MLTNRIQRLGRRAREGCITTEVQKHMRFKAEPT